MKQAELFLLIGIVLSILSKILQFFFGSIWGDIIILPAAVFFVVAILLFIPRYQTLLQNDSTRKRAKVLALTSCLAILFFQLFTMFTFGRAYSWGWLFLLPVLLFAGVSISIWFPYKKDSNP